MLKQKTDLERIQELYAQLNNKGKFIRFAAKELGKKTSTLRVWWFSSWWEIPEDEQPRVLELLTKEIEKQKLKAAV